LQLVTWFERDRVSSRGQLRRVLTDQNRPIATSW